MTKFVPGRLWLSLATTAWLLAPVESAFSIISAAAAEPVIAGKVVGIQDGDTLTMLDTSHEQYRVRLAGIDAPEKSQPFGHDSKDNLSRLAFGEIAAADCPKTDRYGRLVCVVRVNGVDLGLSQLAGGFAWHYKKYEQEQSIEDRATYSAAEAEARSGKMGLWHDSEPVPPWEWRHRK